MNTWFDIDDNLSTNKTFRATEIYKQQNKEKRVKDLVKFISIAKKEHYNEPNYGKLFIV